MTRLRVATFNIAHGRGRGGVVGLRRTTATLASLDADIICLQEVDRHYSERSGWADQATELAAALGMTAVWGVAMRRPSARPGQPPAEYGNAILTRLPVVEQRVVRLPGRPPAEPRSMVIAALAGGLHVACLHLQHDSAPARAEQLAVALQELPEAPVMLAGDFNATPDAPELGPVRERLVDCWDSAGRGRGASFPSRFPLRRLDYVFVSLGLSARRAAVVPTTASDHRPLVVDLVRDPA
ncbi:MAG: endonuclease/exonuclease/phosphatase family protein [Geodermatophilaceae bacterium]|nr:endonuclease/exonuclease/phosphatase family protein [Geodermatophilaceae bacterium]